VTQNYYGVLPRIFLNPKIVHITLCMLPLETEEQVDKARQALKTVEEPINKLITE